MAGRRASEWEWACTSTTPATPQVANAYAALEGDATLFESSVGGVGGCPFAACDGERGDRGLRFIVPRAGGVETGIDLAALHGVAGWL